MCSNENGSAQQCCQKFWLQKREKISKSAEKRASQNFLEIPSACQAKILSFYLVLTPKSTF